MGSYYHIQKSQKSWKDVLPQTQVRRRQQNPRTTEQRLKDIAQTVVDLKSRLTKHGPMLWHEIFNTIDTTETDLKEAIKQLGARRVNAGFANRAMIALAEHTPEQIQAASAALIRARHDASMDRAKRESETKGPGRGNRMLKSHITVKALLKKEPLSFGTIMRITKMTSRTVRLTLIALGAVQDANLLYRLP